MSGRIGAEMVRAVVTPDVVETMFAGEGLDATFAAIVETRDVAVRVHDSVLPRVRGL